MNNTLLTTCLLVTLFLTIAFFSGCSAKNEPLVVTEFKEVYIPIKCFETMPIKPQFNENNLNSVKALSEYYIECEIKLKACLNEL